MAIAGYYLTQRDVELFRQWKKNMPRLEDAANRILNLRSGPGVRVNNGPAGIVLNAQQARQKPQQTAAPTASSSAIQRFIITTAGAAGTGGPYVVAQAVDSSNTPSGVDVKIVPTGHRAVNEYLFAYEPEGGTGVTSSGDVTWQETGTKGMLFKVRLTQTGGSAGTNKSAACSFVYTVKDAANSITLGTGIALTGKGNGWRGLLLELTAATYGWAQITDAGIVELLFADEYAAGEQDCT